MSHDRPKEPTLEIHSAIRETLAQIRESERIANAALDQALGMPHPNRSPCLTGRAITDNLPRSLTVRERLEARRARYQAGAQ